MYNKKNLDLKLTSKEPEYRLVWFRGVEVQLLFTLKNNKIWIEVFNS